jgi:hypothetical protein
LAKKDQIKNGTYVDVGEPFELEDFACEFLIFGETLVLQHLGVRLVVDRQYDLAVGQNRQLHGFFEQASFALFEANL